MTSSFYRQHKVLQKIPRAPQSISMQELHAYIRHVWEIEVDRRTIQRDIETLCMAFPIDRTDGNPPTYSLPASSQVELLPGHDDFSALTWNLLEEYLGPLIPDSMAREVQPVFDTARRYLERGNREQIKRWRQRVRMIPRALPLQPPRIEDSVLASVYETLWNDEALSVEYQARNQDKPRKLTLHPQALVIREGVHYLLAMVNDYEDIRHLALHRMHKAENAYRDARQARDFDLDAYIRAGGFAYAEGGPIDLVLRMTGTVAAHLAETPLTDEQTITELGDDSVEIRARVLDTQQLRWWLLGFGAGIEVIGPAELRDWMRENARAMFDHYKE